MYNIVYTQTMASSPASVPFFIRTYSSKVVTAGVGTIIVGVTSPSNSVRYMTVLLSTPGMYAGAKVTVANASTPQSDIVVKVTSVATAPYKSIDIEIHPGGCLTFLWALKQWVQEGVAIPPILPSGLSALAPAAQNFLYTSLAEGSLFSYAGFSVPNGSTLQSISVDGITSTVTSSQPITFVNLGSGNMTATTLRTTFTLTPPVFLPVLTSPEGLSVFQGAQPAVITFVSSGVRMVVAQANVFAYQKITGTLSVFLPNAPQIVNTVVLKADVYLANRTSTYMGVVLALTVNGVTLEGFLENTTDSLPAVVNTRTGTLQKTTRLPIDIPANLFSLKIVYHGLVTTDNGSETFTNIPCQVVFQTNPPSLYNCAVVYVGMPAIL